MRALSLLVLAVALAGCGLSVQAPDLFLLKRTGQGGPLTLLVSDGGTIQCNGGAARPLADPLLLRARDLATSLDPDARRALKISSPPDSVATYVISLQNGTISFPDTAGRSHPELAQAELFAVQVAQQACGLAG